MSSVITLLSDFGERDPYVGVMKGVLARLAPEAHLIDLTHQIERHNLGIASFWLERTCEYFEKGTVHLVVVDPGVGSERRAIAFELWGHYFVGPDNGVFSDILQRKGENLVKSAVLLDRQLINPGGRRGTTFDGRDLFAPAAGLLASGHTLPSLGEVIAPKTLKTSSQMFDPARPRVRVIDHYGNLLTDAQLPEALAGELPKNAVSICGKSLPWAHTYSAAQPGQPVALRGSFGTIEIAVNQGSAREILGAEIGTEISID